MSIIFKTEEERNPTQPIVTPAILEAKTKHNPTTGNKVEFTEPPIANHNKSGIYEEFDIVSENDLTQSVFAEGEEEQLAIRFIEENALYTKFMLWCGIQEQLKNLKDSLVIPTE
jgi:hypothetical protein